MNNWYLLLPKRVQIPEPVVAVKPGIAITADGRAYGWGFNGWGQAGTGTGVTGLPAPVVDVGGSGQLSGVTVFSGGADHHLALTSIGSGATSTLSAGTPVTFSTNAGATFDDTIASFDDSQQSSASDFTADVDWGDGSTSGAFVSGPDGGPFTIEGVHVYTEPGSHAVKITVTKRDGDSVSLTATAQVGNVTLNGLPLFDSTFTAGESSHQSLAMFADPNTASSAASFTATVDWGDGSPSQPADVSGPPGGPFTIGGAHAYRRAGSYALVLHATDRFGASITLSGHAVVLPAALTIDAMATSDAASGRTFSGVVANIRDGNPQSLPTDYAARIDWGDGSQSDGTVSGPNGGPYVVTGTHTYADSKPYTVVVTVTGPGDARAEGTTTLLFAAPKISLRVTATPASGNAPLNTTYEYVARNDGSEPLTNVAVGGDLCGARTYSSGDNGNGVLDPAEQWTFRCTASFPTPGTFVDTSWASGFAFTSGLEARSDNVATTVTAMQFTAITKNPQGLGYWQTHPAEWTSTVLARIAALDSQFAGVDPKAVFKATGQPATLRAQLLATYFNLATNRIALTTRIQATGFTTVGDAATYSRATLALPYNSTNKTRYSNTTTLLENINENKIERY